MPHPAVPPCLSTADAAKPWQRGGTLVREEVIDLDEHRRLVADVDAYRPSSCANCGCSGLHSHGTRCRKLQGDPDTAAEVVRRFRCPPCRAVWQVLPSVIARHLHRRWSVVQSTVAAQGTLKRTGAEQRTSVPRRTARRWVGRLLLSAVMLAQMLIGAGAKVPAALVEAECSRAELVDAFAQGGSVPPARKLEKLASWIHREEPGVRLM